MIVQRVGDVRYGFICQNSDLTNASALRTFYITDIHSRYGIGGETNIPEINCFFIGIDND